jgi:hypothetical protein
MIEKYFEMAPMSRTSPTRLSYDVFVSDGPAGAGDERMPDGAPLAWSPLSTTLIFGAHDALLADPPFTRTQMAAGLRYRVPLEAPQSALAEADTVLGRGSTFTERRSP